MTRPAQPLTVFLVNPASANGSTRRAWPEIAHRAAALGLEGDVLFSERPGQLRELAAQAAEHAGLVVVVGGDGSLNEAAAGLVGTGAELALIPRGTGVDFVRTFGGGFGVQFRIGE